MEQKLLQLKVPLLKIRPSSTALNELFRLGNSPYLFIHCAFEL